MILIMTHSPNSRNNDFEDMPSKSGCGWVWSGIWGQMGSAAIDAVIFFKERHILAYRLSIQAYSMNTTSVLVVEISTGVATSTPPSCFAP